MSKSWQKNSIISQLPIYSMLCWGKRKLCCYFKMCWSGHTQGPYVHRIFSAQKRPSSTCWYAVAAGLDAGCTEQLPYHTWCLIPVDTSNQLQWTVWPHSVSADYTEHVWDLSRMTTQSAFLPIFGTSNVTSVTEVQNISTRSFVGMWRPLVSVIRTHYYVAIIFHRQLWYRWLSLRYACIQSLGIILIP